MYYINISDLFKKKIMGAFGKEGKAWLATLEIRVETFLARWDLSFEAVMPNLSYNYVVKVKDSNGKPMVLKLGIPNYDFQNEIRCLQAYDGKGCVQLLKADPKHGAMLLERLDPGIMLSEEKDEEVVIQQYIKVWKAIRSPRSASATFPTIMDWAAGLNRFLDRHPEQNGPISSDLIRVAEQYLREITNTSEELQLLHGDLHHENILYSNQHGWMAIDPKGVIGDPYLDFVPFLVNHLHNKLRPKELLKWRIDVLCKAMDLDRERLLKAAVAMATLSACWGIEDRNPDWQQIYQCVEWFHELLEFPSNS